MDQYEPSESYFEERVRPLVLASPHADACPSGSIRVRWVGVVAMAQVVHRVGSSEIVLQLEGGDDVYGVAYRMSGQPQVDARTVISVAQAFACGHRTGR